MKIWFFGKSINWHNLSDIDQGRKKTQITKIRSKKGQIATNLREINIIVKE